MHSIKNYVYPESIDELLQFLRDNNSQILAGGSDLAINVNSNTLTLIDIQRLPLKFIKKNESGFIIGSLTTAYEIYTDVRLPKSIRDAAFKVSDTPLLHAVTIGGNVAKIYPWCDLPPILWALGSKFTLYENSGKKIELESDEFFSYSKKQNISNRNAFIEEIFIPKPSKNSFSQYQKFGLTEIDKGQVNLASYFTWNNKGIITDVRLIVNAITKSIQRLEELEQKILGRKLTDAIIEKSIKEDVKRIEIIPNYKSSIDFRVRILQTFLRRTIQSCMEVQV